jgi:predicted nucleotidyltransferase
VTGTVGQSEETSRTADLAAEAVHRAHAVFGVGLLAAFVGGSRASGVHRDDSDIDAFVLIEHSDHERESEYAIALRDLHNSNGLSFDHYGEIFDRTTLESLLRFTELVDETLPKMTQAPCYRGNCLLSIYRKGRVVLEFLAAPKVHVLDHHGVLSELERRSKRYLAVRRTDLPSRTDAVVLGDGTTQRRLHDQWKAQVRELEGLDTPVGVDLRRWFGSDLNKRGAHLTIGRRPDAERITTLECPISLDPPPQRNVYVMQCLSTRFS